MNIYDAVIIGGGYAGISAAIYLARFNRSTIVIDKGDGRWNTHEFNENYFGFPDGIQATELRDRGLKQAKKFGSKFVSDQIINISKENNGNFYLKSNKTKYLGKTLIIATGVKDEYPKFKNWKNYLGKSLFWCITCDGFRTKKKTVAIVGNNNHAAETCTQFINFTNSICFLTNNPKGNLGISKKFIKAFKEFNIPIYEGVIQKVDGQNGIIKNIEVENQTISADFMFSQLGISPNSNLAKRLGVKTNKKGYILINNNQRTNIPKIFAAGDVTAPFAHQIVSAVHQGAQAAQSANYDLYLPAQKG